MNGESDVREGGEADLPGIARVLVDTWRSTFEGLLPQTFLDGLSYAAQEERHRRMMTAGRARYFVRADRHRGDIVGFACGGADRESDGAGRGEIYAIYVRSEEQARGVGTALLRAVARDLASAGRTRVIVWMLAENPNARFYLRLGARSGDGRPIDLGATKSTEIPFIWDDIRVLVADEAGS